MKKISQHEDQLLTDYLDGKLDAEQQIILETKLKADPDLRSRFESLQAAHVLMQATTLEQPSRNFTTLVMSRLNEYPLRPGIGIRNGIMLLLGILVLVSIAVTLSAAGVFDNDGMLDLNNLVANGRYLKQSLPSIPVDGELIVNSIIVLNLGIALLVFDRAILKPFFERRRQAGI